VRFHHPMMRASRCFRVGALRLAVMLLCGATPTKAPPPPAVYHNPATWNGLNAAGIQALLRDHLLDPTKVPSYEGLAFFVAKQEFDSALLQLQLGVLVRSPAPNRVDGEKYASSKLNNVHHGGEMRLANREPVIDRVILADKPNADSQKRWVAWSFSMRGSGKTQLLKHLACHTFGERLTNGRVLVRCCDIAQSEPWLSTLRSPGGGCAKQALCELVKSHVLEVTGQPGGNFNSPREAYATWIAWTKSHFGLSDTQSRELRPVVLLDTCELLAQEHDASLRHTTGSLYTLLESLCLAVPSPYGSVVVGCNASIAETAVAMTMANLTSLGSLSPISADQYNAVLSEWNKFCTDKLSVDPEMKDVVLSLSGGIPRLLYMAHDPVRVSLACGSRLALTNCLRAFFQKCSERYAIAPESVHMDLAYACLLASVTKLPIAHHAVPVPMPKGNPTPSALPPTFVDAVSRSVGVLVVSPTVSDHAKPWRFMVPPAMFGTQRPVTVFGAPPPIPIDKLHPYLRDDVQDLIGGGATSSGIPFEEGFVYALYARYLLVRWRGGGQEPWVALHDVLEAAVAGEHTPAGKTSLAHLEVNLSEGVRTDVSTFAAASDAAQQGFLCWTHHAKASAHHDIYISCRDRRAPAAVEPAAFQLRFGKAKTGSELLPQMLVSAPVGGKKLNDEAKLRFPLLVVTAQQDVYAEVKLHYVSIDASRMMAVEWLDLIHQKRLPKSK
jgi:hypothetical protein